MSHSRRLKRSIARRSTVLGVASGVVGLTLAAPLGGAATAAPDEGLTVVNQETVQARLDSSGGLDVARVYNQLTVLGAGTVEVQDPSSGKNLRDLDGFSTPLVRDGKAQYSITSDGHAERRTVADHTGELPVTLKVSYTLDGEPVQPEDVVGRSGLLEATYTVVNTTAAPTEITYKNGKGEELTETVDLVTPYVGSLEIDLPSRFSSVDAPGADDGGNGRGGTSLSWSLVLFDPLGSPAQRVSWSAHVEDAELPPATMQVIPVDTGGNRVLESGLQSIGAGATAASALTAGAFKIDGKVLEVRDGARKIFEGLEKLQAGAEALRTGLADTAAPGAQKLSDGLTAASSGGQQLDSGLAQLLAGSTTLSDGLDSASAGGTALSGGLAQLLAGGGRFVEGLGTAAAGGTRLAEGLRSTTGQPDLAGGAQQVADGLAAVRDGVAQLAGVEGLPAAQAGLQRLLFGLDHAPGTLGADDAGGLLQGLTAIAAGLSHPVGAGGAADRGGVKEGLAAVLHPTEGLPTALAGVTASRSELATKLAPGGDLDRLVGGAAAVRDGVDSTVTLTGGLCTYALPALSDAHPAKAELAAGCAALFGGSAPTGAQRLTGGAAAVATGVADVRASTQTSYANLGTLETGLSNAVTGLGAIQAGVDQLAAGSAKARDGVATQVVPGVQALVDGVTSAVTGITGQLAPGVSRLAAGSATLAEKTGEAADGAAALSQGLGTLAAGGGQLATGAGAAAAGAEKLSTGLGQLAAGGQKLEDGLGSAKTGSGKLVDGLGQLDAGGQKLADGLGSAADGSGKIADGVTQVKDGVGQLADGTNRLSGEGTSLLATSANFAASDNAKKAAMLAAMAEKGKDGALPYGAPEGAAGAAAYSYVLAGADSSVEDNATRGAAALALLALGSLSAFVVRRRTVG